MNNKGNLLMRSIRGMYDILPGEIEYWQHIYNVAMDILGMANYQEIRTPIIESTSLFTRSIGKGTDIVNKEMYSFIDQGNRELTLRPEGTASVARAIVEHKLVCGNQVQRLWYLGPMFRYERPQHGRQRQFHQLGIECSGSNNPLIDAEAIYLAQFFLKTISGQDYCIEINSIGTLKNRICYAAALREYLFPYKNDLDIESRIRLDVNPIKILDTKSLATQKLLEDAPRLCNYLDAEASSHFEMVKDYLSVLGVNVTVNHNLVRGLDYYNNTAFEIKTNQLGTQNTICGGGRYDGLIKQLGGEDIPSVGWAIGVERLLLLVQEKIQIERAPICFYIAIQGYSARKHALKVIQKIQKARLKFELDLTDSTFQKQIKKASKKGAMICVIIGEDEVENGRITLKWLKEYRQVTCSLQEFEESLVQIQKVYKGEIV
jgi:histidyl-tRNA synthetase